MLRKKIITFKENANESKYIAKDFLKKHAPYEFCCLFYRCHEPVEMKGQTLLDLEQRNYHMRCLDKYGHQPEKDALLLVGVLIGLLLAIPISLVVFTIYRRRLRTPAHYSRAFYKPADSIHEFTTA